VIPLKILKTDALASQALKSFEDGKIFGERKSFLLGRYVPEAKEELEKVAQDHQMAHVLPFQIQESEKGLHLSTIPSGEMSV